MGASGDAWVASGSGIVFIIGEHEVLGTGSFEFCKNIKAGDTLARLC